MILYLIKLVHKVTGKVMYKIGHTKWSADNFHKRFDYPEYECFEITLLASYQISHSNWTVAKTAIITAENMIRAVIPPKDPSFMIEDYFEQPRGSMKLSGVTEMVFLTDDQTEQDLINTFKKFGKAIAKTALDLKDKIK
jgi:hypothetical protein